LPSVSKRRRSKRSKSDQEGTAVCASLHRKTHLAALGRNEPLGEQAGPEGGNHYAVRRIAVILHRTLSAQKELNRNETGCGFEEKVFSEAVSMHISSGKGNEWDKWIKLYGVLGGVRGGPQNTNSRKKKRLLNFDSFALSTGRMRGSFQGGGNNAKISKEEPYCFGPCPSAGFFKKIVKD